VWQVAHCAVTVTCVCVHFVGVQPVTLWQLKQLVAPTGMCVPDLPVAVPPLWQDAQLVAALNVLWSTLAEDQVLVDLWQLSQLPVTVACSAFDGLPTAGGKAPVWQLAQPVEMDAFACTLAGVHAPKPDLWQVSQLAAAVAGLDAYGTCVGLLPSAGG
jgi:hypothetical protein